MAAKKAAGRRPSENEFRGLSCLWCRHPLSPVDAYRCKYKGFTPVFRKGERFGSCTECLETVLTIERTVYSCRHLYTADVYATTNVHAENLRIRCYYCGSPLTPNEKYRHKKDNEPYSVIRGGVRGRCSICSQDGTRTVHNEKSASR
ncbi:E6 protein [Giraffa camelopardalis papillomavirus 1]|uniref:Protein E6 n=1 Tax=Giraffa camelopardalis papillomavirus 1 TaxID=1922325 RepID=A0A1L3GV97_9PAPI|nr:E6 protein [Giraffa camelopardalis papillomavirus 1]APG30979.1 E6 protein [Giraffa camelopardalis papillomavirus 1]